MKKKIIGLFAMITLIFTSFAWMIPVHASVTDENSVIISESDIPLRLWYTEEAPKINENASHPDFDGREDDGWQQWSLPIGNAYFGASVFGRTETERVQITEKTLANKHHKISGSEKNVSYGGLNNFSETYIDFGHTNSAVTDYVRYLDMKTAVSGVEYTYNGVTYTREYFTSYPDKALVIRLDADTDGALSFTLRPTIPYEQSAMAVAGDGMGKSGTVTSTVENGVGYIELAGKLEYYDVDFLGIYKVYTDGGTVTASTTQNTYKDYDGTEITDTDGTIVVDGAKSAYIVVTLGTDYELSSEIFTTSDTNKPTFKTDLDDTRVKVEADMNAIDEKINGKSFNEAYELFKDTHIADHSELFGRVTLDLGCAAEDFAIPTDELLEAYKAGYKSTYLEVLLFQYGRYQLIASSREGALPANLQGIWNPYNTAPWASGYWHNINIQMNYWPAFSTNLAETFRSYVDFNNAFMPKAEAYATNNVNKYNPDMLGEDGGNGWVIGVGSYPFYISSDRSAGNLGFTTQMFWEYYQYTQDETILNEIVLPKLLSAARYITKCVELDENGNYLVSYCDSPEVHVDGIWYYTQGTTYAQTFAYLNNYHVLELMKEAGIDLNKIDEFVANGKLSKDDGDILNTIMEQIDKYDPINVGLSGQVKEFREEDYYSSVGDDPNHRHVSQLVGLYPGNVINSNTPAWIDAALVTLDGRGQNTTGGWVYAHKTGLYARAKDGDEARARVDELLSRATFPNLFTRLWDVYQIDASCGVTAGIAEMLLQSNAGYIEPLAAIPESWADGSYTELCAEGNFEVSAAWKNGVATTFNITSKSGKRVGVAYPSITGARVVRASDGKEISYTIEASNRIAFDTEAGETYIISGFSAEEKMSAPSSLTMTRADVFGEFTLDWTAVPGAKSYNVYIAHENSPTYTLLGKTGGTTFNYNPTKENENARTTFAVTAVSAGGTESKRTLCYSNPIDVTASISDTKAYVLESGEAQFVINANSNSEKFRLYSKNNSNNTYTLISESSTPVIRLESYDSSLTYAVSATSFYDSAESELFEVKDFASYSTDYNATNVFEGKNFVQNGTSVHGAALSDKYGYSTLTDGIKASSNIHSGRYSSKMANTTNPVRMADAVIDLGAEYFLDEITFYVYGGDTFLPQIGTNFKLEVYSGGKWVSIVSNLKSVYADDYNEGEASISDYLVNINKGDDKYHLVFDLHGIRGSKVRFYTETILKTGNSSYNYITFWEVECSGILVENIFENEENVLLGKTFTQISSAPSGKNTKPIGGYGYEKMTDGIFDRVTVSNGRYSSVKGGAAYAEADLGGIYSLGEIKFYYYAKNFNHAAGTNYTIEIFYNGEWTAVVNNVPASEIKATNNNSTEGYVFFDLGGIRAEKIRFYAEASASDQYVTYYEVTCSGYQISEFVKQDENLFIGHKFESDLPTATAMGYNFTYDKLTDGKNYVNGTAANAHEGRFSSVGGKDTAEGILTLDETYALDEIRFYLFSKNILQAGGNFTIELYSNGVWRTVVESLSTDELKNYLDSTGNYLSFNLNGMRAEKVKFHTDDVNNKCVTLHEIECYGSKIINRTHENAVKNALSDAAGNQNVTDGNLNTYASGTASGTYSIELSFNSTKLFTLGIYESIDAANLVNGVLSTASDSTKVELYRDGMWFTVYDNKALDNDGYTELNLYGATCERIRITFKNTRKFDGESALRSAKIREITCTPGKPNAVDRTAMAEAYEKLTTINVSTEAHAIKMEEFRQKLTDYLIKAENVEVYAAEMNAYYETVKQDIISGINYVPQMSITLDSQLIVNAYIPAENLQKFTFDGVKYENLAELSEKKITANGKDYYHLTAALPSSLSARDIKLDVTILADGNLATASFTFSIPKYAAKLLADDNAKDVEKTLAKDVLVYVKEAYNYSGFAEDNTREEISRVNALIESIIGDYVGTPTLSGESESNNGGAVTDVTLNLDAAPTIRFYTENSDLEFFANGVKLDTVSGVDSNGAYIELDVYAYVLAETITFGDGGSYRISDFIAGAGENEKALASAFVKYVQSASKYRKSVID